MPALAPKSVARRRVRAIATLGVAATITGTALYGLGSERWISTGYSQASNVPAEVWTDTARPGFKPVLATEAEWLAARATTTALRPTAGAGEAVTGMARIDFGPLDVTDVRPLPAGLDVGTTSAAKLLVSAREPGSGRTLQFIVDAGSSLMAPRARGKHDGL